VADDIPASQSATDPRVERTKLHVLEHARRLLAAEGPAAVTYSELADCARVTRQTLYRHWPTREALFVDLVVEQSMAGMPDGSGTPEHIVGRFLRALRDDMNDPAHAGPLVALIAQADFEPTSDSALGHVVTNVCATLNALLASCDYRVSTDDYARLCGPVIFKRFVAREQVTDEFLDTLVAGWAADQQSCRPVTKRSAASQKGKKS
jgi:AcrR family transcriptional regulator